jgi:peptidoglycan/xylan/chitin deacetylase (PgdA/CDA1 family)
MNVAYGFWGATFAVCASLLVHCSSDTTIYRLVPQGAPGNDGGASSDSRSGGSAGADADAATGSSGSGLGTDAGSGSGSAGAFEGPQNPKCLPLGTAANPGTYPETGFEAQPTYIPNNVVVFTFDDVPDTTWTVQDLAWLRQNNLHVDFFTNTMNYGGSDALITQMFTDGHYVGNHTVHHLHLATMSASAIDTEISSVEQTIASLTHPSVPHLTRFRAPFGEPYQAGGAADMALVGPVVAKYAVEIDWNIDSGDSSGINNGVALYNNLVQMLLTPGASGASWGIILMHGVYQWTHDALPMLVDYLKKNGFKLGSAEDVICWKFGKHSWEIIPGRMPN